MDDQELLRRASELSPFYRQIIPTSPGGRLLERDGVIAGIAPACPARSVVNAVVYDDVDKLAASLDELVDAYEDAGIVAWTVWVPAQDVAATRLLEDAGHKLDAAPRAMAFELKDFEPGETGATDIEHTDDIEILMSLNDSAYGHTESTFTEGLTSKPEALRGYIAREGGKPVACTCSFDISDDCSIWWVATLAQARGKGLGSALMTQALVEGKERGCVTTSLQATKMGAPVYSRLGYKDLGELQMWERRKP